MSYQFRLTQIPESTLMAVHAQVRPPEFPRAIREGLDKVWAYIRANGVKPGHNVVVYRGLEPCSGMSMDAGVQVEAPLPGDGTVVPVTTPGGLVATTVHSGPYDKLGDASEALHRFCTEKNHRIIGPTWELYGDWAENPADLRTDVFVLVAS